MRTYLVFLSLLAMSAFSMNACALNDRDATTSRETTTAKMSNSDLENKVKAKFDSDPQIKAADLDIDTDVDKSSVTLSGTVVSQALRSRAVELAKSAHSGLIITDKIDVKPREVARVDYTEEMARNDRDRARRSGDTVGDTVDDAWVHTKIVAKLIGNTDTPQRKINVDVKNNVVTLRGTVDTAAQKAEAEQVAKTTEGVKRVINQLKVAG